MATLAPPPVVAGFSIARPQRRYRLVASIAGLDKCGKTHLALDAPGPIAFGNLDTGLEGVVEKFQRAGKAVYTKDYRVIVPPGADITAIAGAGNLKWEEIKKDMREAWKSPVFRSTVVDTESDLWQMCRLARFGKLTQVMPHHYGPVNSEYAGFLNEVYDSDKNLILLGKLKEEWENDAAGKGKKTGDLSRVGFKELQYIVQVNCIARYDSAADTGERFSLEIVNCRQNPEIAGTIIPQQFPLNFMSLAMMVHPDSKESDWL